MIKFLKYFALLIVGVALSASMVILGAIAYVQFRFVDRINLEQSPVEYAIVLGASVKSDGTPSDALYDRVMTAVELYKNDYVQKLLMTGDDGKFHTNEVAVMRRIAVELGVPEEDILVDGHGYRTYESCKRAHEVFGIKEAVIVTQRFHLARAIFLCSHFEILSQGRIADRQTYARIVYFWIRDLTSSFKAWWDIYIQQPEAVIKDIS